MAVAPFQIVLRAVHCSLMGQANQTTLRLVLGAATRSVLQLAQHLEDLDQQVPK